MRRFRNERVERRTSAAFQRSPFPPLFSNFTGQIGQTLVNQELASIETEKRANRTANQMMLKNSVDQIINETLLELDQNPPANYEEEYSKIVNSKISAIKGKIPDDEFKALTEASLNIRSDQGILMARQRGIAARNKIRINEYNKSLVNGQTAILRNPFDLNQMQATFQEVEQNNAELVEAGVIDPTEGRNNLIDYKNRIRSEMVDSGSLLDIEKVNDLLSNNQYGFDADVLDDQKRKINTRAEKFEREAQEKVRVEFYDQFWPGLESANTIDQFGSLIDIVNAQDNEILHPTQKFNLRSMIRDRLEDYGERVSFDFQMERVIQNEALPRPNDPKWAKGFNEWFDNKLQTQAIELNSIEDPTQRASQQRKFWNENGVTFNQAQLIPDSIIQNLDSIMVDQDTDISRLETASAEFGVYERIAPEAMSKFDTDSAIAYRYINALGPGSESRRSAVQRVMNSRKVFYDPAVRKALKERFGTSAFNEKIDSAVSDQYGGLLPGFQASIANQVERRFQLGFDQEGDLNKAISQTFHNLSQTPEGVSESTVSTTRESYPLFLNPTKLNPHMNDEDILSDMLRRQLEDMNLYEGPRSTFDLDEGFLSAVVGGIQDAFTPQKVNIGDIFRGPPTKRKIKVPLFTLEPFKDTANVNAWLIKKVDVNGNVTYVSDPDTGNSVMFQVNQQTYDLMAKEKEGLAREIKDQLEGEKKGELLRFQREMDKLMKLRQEIPGIR